MELTNRESALIAYALNKLAITGDTVILATTGDIRELASRVVIDTIKENK